MTEVADTPLQAQYQLGRDARQRGYPLEACNLPAFDRRRAWWVGGWIDEDLESGNRVHWSKTEGSNNGVNNNDHS